MSYWETERLLQIGLYGFLAELAFIIVIFYVVEIAKNVWKARKLKRRRKILLKKLITERKECNCKKNIHDKQEYAELRRKFEMEDWLAKQSPLLLTSQNKNDL